MSDLAAEHVKTLAELYRKHFQATSYKEGARALEEAEAFHKELEAAHGADYARAVEREAYRIGHG